MYRDQVENVYVIVGERIKRAREAAGLKQEELGALMDPPMSKTRVSAMETADRRVYLHRLMQVAQITGQPISWFVPGIEENQADELRAKVDRLRNSIIGALKELQKGV